MEKVIKYLFILMILASVLVGMFIGFKRFLIERRNNEVEIVIDFNDIQTQARMDGIHPNYLLSKYKDKGIRSIALPEETLDSSKERGVLTWASGSEILDSFRLTYSMSPMFKNLLKRNEINPRSFYIAFAELDEFKRVRDELRLLLGDEQVNSIGTLLEVKDAKEELELLGVGINPRIYASLKLDSFKVIPRLKNSFRLTSSNISRKLNMQEFSYDDDLLIFDDEEVMGYPNYLKTVANEFRRRDLNFGFIEFSKQKGDTELAKLLKGNVIRVHSISKEEMETISYSEALERWLRAVKERGIRVLYVHPFLKPVPGYSITQTNMMYLNDLMEGLKENDFVLGSVKPLRNFRLEPTFVLLLSIGAIAGTLLVLSYFVTLPTMIWLLAFIFIFLSSGFLLYKGYALPIRKIYALISASIFPALSILYIISENPKADYSMLKCLKMFFEAVMITILGTFLVIGFISDSLFMSGTEVFTGVKIAFILPLLITAAYFLFQKGTERDPVKKLLSLFDIKISIMHILLFFVFACFAALIVLRSGNFGIPLFPYERKLRLILENFLFVRPRTKELITYPLLFLSIVYYLKGGRKWLWVLLPVSTVALSTTLNTFCHIHSPLLISSLRSLYGIVIGLLIGFGIFGGYSWWKRNEENKLI